MLRLPAAALLTVLIPSTVTAPRAIVGLAPVEVWADGFADLRGVAVAPDGRVYVADRGRGEVVRVTGGGLKVVVASALASPTGLALDPAGRLLVVEDPAGRVVRLERDGRRTVVAAGLRHPRWLALSHDALYVSARGLIADADSPHGEAESDPSAPGVIVAIDAGGAARVVVRGVHDVQGLATDGPRLYAVARGRSGDPAADGIVLGIALTASGAPGTTTLVGPGHDLRRPVGLAVDRLGSLFLTSHESDVLEGDVRRGIAKVQGDGAVTVFAAGLDDPRGLAFDADGSLFVADGRAGRLLRFRAPPAPVLSVSPFGAAAHPVMLAGTAEAGARIDVRPACAAERTIADGTGAFALSVGVSAASTVDVTATAEAGAGLTSAPTVTPLTRVAGAPACTPAAGAAGPLAQ